MISQEERNMVYFLHKTLNRLAIANVTHGRAEKNLDLETFAESVDGAKECFREFLEDIIQGRQTLRLPPYFTIETIKEAYARSDFDWKDRRQYRQFHNWFCGLSLNWT